MSGGGGKILVVEDDDVQRESLVELLRLWGYQARAASNGWQALQEIRSSAFEVVLADADMPGMSGIALLQELRRNSYFVSCIMISGNDDAREESQAARLGVRSILRKPIYPDQLKAEMRKCVDARRALGHGQDAALVERERTGKWPVTN